MKAIEIKNVVENLGTRKIMEKIMPPKMALAVDANLRALSKEAESIDRQRVAIVERYARKDENGDPVVTSGQYVLTDEGKKAVPEEVEKLYDTDIEVSIRKITEADIEECGAMDRYSPLAPVDIALLRFMIE